MKKELPLVAIVGQPNVGKSTLLNKISGKSLAVTSPVAGTTRDRQYMDTQWNGTSFTLVDTAGISFGVQDALEISLNKQIDIAVKEAAVIVLVVDGKLNKLSVDRATLKKFRNTKKPILLAVNKLDSPKAREEKLVEFQSLGIKNMFGISSISGRGIGDLLDAIVKEIYQEPVLDIEPEEPVKNIAITIVGKPNVGKSSIFNSILKEERVVVSPIPGTTRTAIDSEIVIDGQEYTFIDTAGLKKKEHRQSEPDVYSGFQTFKSIRRSDICFFVIDANEEITKQDQRVAQEIFALEKGCIILANKADLISESAIKSKISRNGKTRTNVEKPNDDKYQSIRDYISHHFPFLWMCPMFFVSGLTGEGLNEALSAIKPIFESRAKEISSDTFNEFLNKIMKKNPPKLLRDQKAPKVYNLNQLGHNPPTFQLVVNQPAAISGQFRKFLENSIIRDLGFWGTPIKIHLISKDKL